MLSRIKKLLFLEKLELRQLSLFHPARPLLPKKLRARSKRITTYQTDPFLHQLWCKLRAEYFPERSDLDTYTISWSSRRQRRTLGSCNVDRRVVRIAKELKDSDYQQWLSPLIYHEMCHAYLGLEVARHRGKRCWHGKEFKALERKHPHMKEFDQWVSSGGWAHAVRRDRARHAAAARFRKRGNIA